MTSNELQNGWLSKSKAWGTSLPARAGDISRSPVWRRRAAWSLGGLLAFWALAWAAVPTIAKSQIEKIASEKLGRSVTLGAVDFKPWSLELTLSDLVVAKSTPSTLSTTAASAQLSIKRIYIDAELQSLLRLAPVLDAVRVEDPAVSLTHLGQGRYDIDDILERLKPPAGQPASEPPRFAFYNIVLSSGRVDFNDQSVGRTHEMRDVNLSVPFVSNLQSKRDVNTAPRLAFKLNGSSFDTAAEGTPFAQTRKTDATFKLAGFDIAPYLGYLPASLPFRLKSAVLNADARVSFEQSPAAVVKVSGVVTADKVELTSASSGKPARKNAAANAAAPTALLGNELLAFEQLRITMDDVRPLEQFVNLAKVELTAPVLHITRSRAGQLNLLPPAPDDSNNATKNVAGHARIQGPVAINGSQKGVETASKPASSASSNQAVAAASPWKVQVASVAVRSGRVNWLDETLASPAEVAFREVSLDASSIAFPFVASSPLQFNGAIGLETNATTGTPTAAVPSKAQIAFSGTATDQAAQVTASVAAWPLNMAAKYIGQFLLPALGGQLDAQLGINWQAASSGKPQALQVTASQLALSDVLLAQGKVSLVSVKRVDVAGVDIDVPGQTFKAAKLLLTQPKALVDRDPQKRWMYERWLVASAVTATPQSPATSAASKAAAPSWAVAINDVELIGGAMSFSDKAGAKPVAFEVSAANAQLVGLVLDDRLSSTPAKGSVAKLMPLTASLRLASGRFEPGTLRFKGDLGLTPIQAQGQLSIDRLPAQAFEPYFADALNIELLRADASFKGRVAYRQTPAGPLAKLNGNLAIEELKANTLAPSEDLLAWKALNLRGLSIALDPAKATQLDVQETVLTDFFARVIVMPEGRINLQDLVKTSAASTSPGSDSSVDATKTIAGQVQKQGVTALNEGKKATSSAVLGSPAIPTGKTDTGPAPVINFGPITLVNGKVLFSDRFVKPNYSANLTELTGEAGVQGPAPIINFGPLILINGKVLFSDRFIKPNYTANLTELTGKLSAFSSEAPTGNVAAPVNMADLELRGRAEGTASLEIVGKLNPLAKPLALDITGKVRDLELPPLSPYAIKYAGYGISRGKMSVDVNYVVLPNGQLTARNKLVLNQLSFGDKVDGAPASLPVKLAVALLADRNGVIDLDLPISGSLNDPQFSLGPVIVKVILNVITKAITAPFSLLANAFGGGSGGGGDELSSVSFAAGSAQLTADAKAGLDKVAKALTERPALKLTVVGTSNLDAERDGFKRERLDELIRAEKRRVMVKDGGTPSADISISAADYPALLKDVYKRADMPKPRNVVGLTKDLPEPEMEKLLLADIRVSDDAMRALAVQRGVAVKDYLAAANLPADRLFLGASKSAAPDPKWTPRAELNLAAP